MNIVDILYNQNIPVVFIEFGIILYLLLNDMIDYHVYHVIKNFINIDDEFSR